MLKFFTRALAALAFLLTPSAYAQVAQDADPALWVVQDEDTTIYLFGTVHALRPGMSWFDEAVKDAFDKSDEVMLEMVMPDLAALQGVVMKLARNPGGPTVTELLPEDKRAPYHAALTAVGIPPAALDGFDPWFPAITLSGLSLTKSGYDPEQGVEKVITQAAKDAGKPVGGLETPEQQLGYFDGLSQPVQVKFLVGTITELPKMGESLDALVVKWAKGDPKGLGKLMNVGMADTPELAKALLYDRNARWADWIAERMKKPGTVFIAVGAGHLAGPNSVQDYLKKRKLRTRRIKY